MNEDLMWAFKSIQEITPTDQVYEDNTFILSVVMISAYYCIREWIAATFTYSLNAYV